MVVAAKCVNATFEGQEEQLGALGLVVNAIILWNTYYMNAAVDRLRLNQMAKGPKDLARLSPLGRSHLNFLGRYQFNLPKSVKNGSMRPLRDLNELDELEY